MYLIIFDVDGTLLDSQNTIVHGFETAFSAVGLPAPDRKTILSIVGLSLEEAFQDLVGPEHTHLVALMADAYRTEKSLDGRPDWTLIRCIRAPAKRSTAFMHGPMFC
jgi:phosphoglycolate phosphatase